MTEHTADLRREEIARIAKALVETGVGMDHDGTAWTERVATYAATELYDAGLRSQDTTTARIAALEGALLGAQEQLARTQSWMRGANVVIDKWPPLATGPGYSVKDHTDLTIEERWQGIAFSIYTDLVTVAEQARAVLSGETRTDGETWTGPGERPHSYSPDYQAMGDCKVCGWGQTAHAASPTTPAATEETET